MNRYSIEMSAMQWAIIGVDLGKIRVKEESTAALQNLIRMALEHTEDPLTVLPYNVKEVV